MDSKQNSFRNLKGGEGVPPASAKWDWKDGDGDIIAANKQYVGKLQITDILGTTSNCATDTIAIDVSKRVQRRDKILIVQFVFDEAISRARFFEDRLEYVANLIKQYGEESYKNTTVTVEGHTDVTGLKQRNIELSKNRAEEVYEKLIDYLIILNGLNSESELTRWLDDNNITVKQEGKAAEEPYKVQTLKNGKLQEKLLGDNSLPEGRIINRRVLVNIDAEKTFTE